MAKIFTIIKRNIAAGTGGSGSGGDGENVTPTDGGAVTREKLTYDLPESVPAMTELAQVLLRAESFEDVNQLIEEVVAALLIRADELYNLVESTESITAIVSDIDNIVNTLNDIQSLDLSTYEDLSGLISDIISINLNIDELYNSIEEFVNINATVTENVLADTTSDLNFIDVNTFDNIETNLDTITINGTFNPYASAVVSNTNWANPNNGLGNTTDTATTLSASSSGLLGANQNTVSGTVTYDFANTTFDDLNVANATISVEGSSSINPVLLGVVPNVTVNFQYSTDNTNWTTFAIANDNTGKGVATLNITNIINNDKNLINNLRIRATGSARSGTGIGANATCSFFRSFITVTFTKDY
jgi:hypothetical protein